MARFHSPCATLAARTNCYVYMSLGRHFPALALLINLKVFWIITGAGGRLLPPVPTTPLQAMPHRRPHDQPSPFLAPFQSCDDGHRSAEQAAAKIFLILEIARRDLFARRWQLPHRFPSIRSTTFSWWLYDSHWIPRRTLYLLLQYCYNCSTQLPQTTVARSTPKLIKLFVWAQTISVI